jgi:O-antigen ligase
VRNSFIRTGKLLLAAVTLGLPIWTLLTSWMPERWPALLFDTLAILAAACFLLAYAVQRFPIRLHWSLLAPLSAAAIACIQVATNTTVNQHATRLAAYDWAGYSCFYFLTLQLFTNIRTARKRFGTASIVFGTVFCIFAVVQWFTSNGLIFWRFPNFFGLGQVMGTILNRNHFAAYLELFIPLMLWQFIESPRRNPEAAISVGVLFAAIVASTSRGGLGVAVLELIVVFLLSRYWESRMLAQYAEEEGRRRRGKSSVWLLSGAISALVVFTAAIGTGPLQERFLNQRPGDLLVDYEESRWEYAEASMKMIGARPVSGFGLGTWPEIYPAYGTYDSPHGYVNHAHNDAIEWLAEGGLPFLIPLSLLLCVCLMVAFKDPWALGPLAVLVHSLVDFPLQKPAILATLFVILAAGIICGRVNRAHRATNL